MLKRSDSQIEIPRSVLVLDNERGFLDVVTMILESHGYEVQQANHAHQALGLMDRRKPDLILTDVMMPEVDGFHFLRQVRQRPSWSDIPVVMVSAYDEPEIKESATAAGAEFMAKPFSANQLRSTVGAYFLAD